VIAIASSRLYADNTLTTKMSQLGQIQHGLDLPFWNHPDFWINAVLGAGGLVFAVLAFYAAKGAKTAAKEAGQTITMQTVAIELMAISQRLNNLDPSMQFREARTLLDEVSGKLHRLTAPYQSQDDLAPTIADIHESLTTTKTSLNAVRPSPGTTQPPGATYYAIEADLATLNGVVNDLLGQLETKSHQHLAA
jgi:hypothetical protein